MATIRLLSEWVSDTGGVFCRHGGIGSELRHKPPHEICERCRELSLPPELSDYFVCCKCMGLSPYDRAARAKAMAARRKRARMRDRTCEL
jgi:hypothetical protein